MAGNTAAGCEEGEGPKSAATGAAVWFVGLPGSGKSTLARIARDALAAEGRPVVHLQMDERRKVYFPKPKYTVEEREEAYRLFVKEAAEAAEAGDIVLMDGSAYLVSMRRAARESISGFAEVFVRCSLRTAMQREAARPEGLVMAGLYAKAIKRKATGEQFEGLGEVIGVDVPFEEDPAAECAIDSETMDAEEAGRAVLTFLRTWLPPFQPNRHPTNT